MENDGGGVLARARWRAVRELGGEEQREAEEGEQRGPCPLFIASGAWIKESWIDCAPRSIVTAAVKVETATHDGHRKRNRRKRRKLIPLTLGSWASG